jgi:hypothetical protein
MLAVKPALQIIYNNVWVGFCNPENVRTKVRPVMNRNDLNDQSRIRDDTKE